MELTDRELQELYQHRTRRSAARRPECLTEEMLVRLRSGEVEGDARLKAIDHLADCSDCASEFQLLEPLEQWVGEAAGPLHRQSPRPRQFWMEAVAAAALLAVIGLGTSNLWQWRRSANLEADLARERTAFAEGQRRRSAESQAAGQQIADLQRTLRDLIQPQINVPIVDLEATGSSRGSDSAVTAIDIPAGIPYFTVVLAVADSRMYSGYELQVRDEQGSMLWSGEGLRRSAYGTFTVSLPTRLLAAGRYRLRLLGETGSGKKTIQEYGLHIRYR